VEPGPDDAGGARESRCPLEWEGEDLARDDLRASLEWLETDGLGGYACGTAGGSSLRRYHGWYAPRSSSPRRSPLVACCEEFVWCGGETTAISRPARREAANECPLVRFALDPFPTWLYRNESFSVERALCLVRGRSIAIARYGNHGSRSIGLRARPLLRAGSRPLETPETERDPDVEIRGDGAWIRSLPGPESLFLRGPGTCGIEDTRFLSDAADRAEGTGDPLWAPLALSWILGPGEECFLLFSVDEVATDPAQLMEAERRRRQAVETTEDPIFDELARRAEVFLVDGDEGACAIVGGYPEAAETGRDSMISVSGLTLATSRYAAAARAVSATGARLREGLLPADPTDSDGGSVPADFTSSDSPLWFVLAVEWFTRARRERGRPTPLLGAVRSVLSAYREGKRPGIAVGPDGLMSAFCPGLPLTWMNAMADEQPVTPRYGRAVEVNALWHAALKAAARLERLAEEGGRARDLESDAWHVARRFNDVFWSEYNGYLYDVVGPEGSDSSLRPNQIFAVSLSADLLPPHRARRVYEAVRDRLLTPFGLRTLDPRDPRYRGHCEGSPRDRALALHQGTAWPWLLGAFADAHFRVLGRSAQTRGSLRAWLERLKAHVREAGVGSISQVFDGDEPHTPRGCFAEARSVAEIARVLYTYLKTAS
jgi:hypothetical protein